MICLPASLLLDISVYTEISRALEKPSKINIIELDSNHHALRSIRVAFVHQLNRLGLLLFAWLALVGANIISSAKEKKPRKI